MGVLRIGVSLRAWLVAVVVANASRALTVPLAGTTQLRRTPLLCLEGERGTGGRRDFLACYQSVAVPPVFPRKETPPSGQD